MTHKQESTGPEKFRTRGAADYLEVKRGTLEAWRVRWCGPAFVKLGKNVVYLKSDLDAFINTNRRTSTTAV